MHSSFLFEFPSLKKMEIETENAPQKSSQWFSPMFQEQNSKYAKKQQLFESFLQNNMFSATSKQKQHKRTFPKDIQRFDLLPDVVLLAASLLGTTVEPASFPGGRGTS